MFCSRRLIHLAAMALVLVTGFAQRGLAQRGSADEANWPGWRGPARNGHTVEKGFPVRWDDASVVWKVPLKGRGQSSPIVWGNRMFLTTALDDGRQRLVFALDLADGKPLWEQVAWTGDPEKSHGMNGWASATCVTDGEIVAAFFGKGGLHAYTVDGKHLWSRDLGTFESPWGTAACPVIVGPLVIQNGDRDAGAFIEAFDRKSGKTVWRRARPDHRGWSTPVPFQFDGQTQLVLNGHTGVTAYDPASGEELWFIANSNGRGEPTVTPADNGLMVVVCGLAGDMYAVRQGESADRPEIVWKSARRSGRDLPSPVVVGDYLLVCSLPGIASCYDLKTGKEYWKERLGGQFSSSPIAINGLVYHQNEAGETVVIEPGPSLKIVARNTLGKTENELFRASLRPIRGRIYCRSNQALYCIGDAIAAGR